VFYERQQRVLLHGCRCTDLPSSASHHAGWVDATDVQDRPSFMVSETSLRLGIKEADVLSPSFINPGAGFELPLRLFLVT
jgi:hypothetical protein